MIKFRQESGRSLEENRYYHGYIKRSIAIHKGWSDEKTHEWVKDTFGIESTATLTTKEFEELMENVRMHCWAFWNLTLKKPNE